MTNIINGIDVSEEIRYCNNCSNLGLDFKTGKFYCGLSNRKDELPEILSCENFSSNCYIKRLQEENEGLKSLNDFNVQKIEVLQEENEKLKARLKTLDDEVLTIEITPDEFERYKKYKQALEEIRKEYTNSIFYQCDKTEEECPCHNCIILGQLDRVQNIVKIIDEVLNDRD